VVLCPAHRSRHDRSAGNWYPCAWPSLSRRTTVYSTPGREAPKRDTSLLAMPPSYAGAASRLRRLAQRIAVLFKDRRRRRNCRKRPGPDGKTVGTEAFSKSEPEHNRPENGSHRDQQATNLQRMTGEGKPNCNRGRHKDYGRGENSGQDSVEHFRSTFPWNIFGTVVLRRLIQSRPERVVFFRSLLARDTTDRPGDRLKALGRDPFFTAETNAEGAAAPTRQTSTTRPNSCLR
jgi:hypothetical protein